MTDPAKIVCKPTPWFLFRGVVMFLLFSVLAGWFYYDGQVGYKRKNASYYLRQTFSAADNQFKAEWSDRSAEEWREYAAKQTVYTGQDPSVLPAEVQPGMAWPELLQDSEKLRNGQWNHLWDSYSAEWPHWKMDAEPPEKPYTAEKIQQQWIASATTAILALVAAFFLIRTWFRTMAVDEMAIYTQTGKRIPFTDLKRLDLRKWQSKGLAYADYEGESGRGRIRIDGMTYGGFNKEQGEPGERLMERVRASFSGELINYVSVDEDESSSPSSASEVDSSAKDD